MAREPPALGSPWRSLLALLGELPALWVSSGFSPRSSCSTSSRWTARGAAALLAPPGLGRPGLRRAALRGLLGSMGLSLRRCLPGLARARIGLLAPASA